MLLLPGGHSSFPDQRMGPIFRQDPENGERSPVSFIIEKMAIVRGKSTGSLA
jgi:hypothetical protein